MHKLLSRQTRCLLGVEEEKLPAALVELQQLGATACLSEAAAHVLGGLAGFLARVEAANDQYYRDLGLITRSLQLSSIFFGRPQEQIYRNGMLWG